MRAYVASETSTVTGIGASVETLYEGPRIRFSGVSGGKPAAIEVTMHPDEALSLAWALICCAEKHGKDTQRRVERIARSLAKQAAHKSATPTAQTAQEGQKT